MIPMLHYLCFTKKRIKFLDKIETTEKEVQDIIDSLNLNKASGPDLISHKMIKSVSVAIS